MDWNKMGDAKLHINLTKFTQYNFINSVISI